MLIVTIAALVMAASLGWFAYRLRELVRSLPGLFRRRFLRGPATALEQTIEAVERAGGTHFVMAFSGNEPLRAELAEDGSLARLEALGHVEVRALPGHDHILRPLEAQRAAHDVLDRAVAVALDQVARSATS